MPLTVDLVSDVVCPWCVIGYMQLAWAYESRRDAIALEVRWHPFELNPDMPPEGQNVREHLREKYGNPGGRGSGVREHLAQLGEELGFRFNFSDDMRIVNTFKAHQLLHWAGLEGGQTALKLALFKAYFTDHRDVSRTDELIAIAGEAGLSAPEARLVLSDERYAAAVRSGQQRWLQEGITGVPAFLVNERYLVQGAQDAAAFGRMMDKLLRAQAEQPA